MFVLVELIWQDLVKEAAVIALSRRLDKEKALEETTGIQVTEDKDEKIIVSAQNFKDALAKVGPFVSQEVIRICPILFIDISIGRKVIFGFASKFKTWNCIMRKKKHKHF